MKKTSKKNHQKRTSMHSSHQRPQTRQASRKRPRPPVPANVPVQSVAPAGLPTANDLRDLMDTASRLVDPSHVNVLRQLENHLLNVIQAMPESRPRLQSALRYVNGRLEQLAGTEITRRLRHLDGLAVLVGQLP